jgi:hypothetical protein
MTHDHGSIQSPRSAAGRASPPEEDGQVETGHSMWWMVACCAPMVLLAIAILLGVFGTR